MTTTLTTEVTEVVPAADGADHEISFQTAADDLGGIDPATVRRYTYRAGKRPAKISRMGAGVSANSVEAYRQARTPVEQTRYRRAEDYPNCTIEAAMARQHYYAAEDRRQAGRQVRQAEKVLKELESGVYGPWLVGRKSSDRRVTDMAALKVILDGFGYRGEIPTMPVADSIVVTPVLR